MIKDCQVSLYPHELPLSPEERTFQSQARAYLREVTDGWDVPLDDEEYQARARVVREGLGERGWLTLGWGPPYGPASPVKAAILQEELAYHLVPRANDHGTNLTGPLLLRHGTPEQRERHLGAAGRGPGMVVRRLHRAPRRQRPCQHQDPRRRRRDGNFVLTGQKDYGEWAQLSGWCHLLARTERSQMRRGVGSTGRDGLTWFLLDMSTPGLFLNHVEYTTGRSLRRDISR